MTKIQLTDVQRKFLCKVIDDEPFADSSAVVSSILCDGYYYDDDRLWLNQSVTQWKFLNKK